MTSRIGAEIFATTQKLEKLSHLARSRSLFDDPTVEINELTMIIKQDLSSLNVQVREVQDAMQRHRAGHSSGKQHESHTAQIVEALKLQLGTAAKGFQDVLHTRSENIKVQMDRQKQFDGALKGPPSNSRPRDISGATPAPPPLFTPPRATTTDDGDDAPPVDTVIDIGTLGTPGAGAQVQVQELVSSNYLESRANAVETVQSTIVELGGIFQQLQTVIAHQHLMVERIDAEVEDTVSTVDSTQRQLLRLYQSMSGNRLAMKMVGVIVFFLMFYGLFVA